MKKIYLVFVFIYLCNTNFAQTTLELNSDSSSSKINTKVKILKLKMSGNSLVNFESLKSELIAWEEKVKFIDINENTKEFTLIHYMTMDNRELFDVLGKYNIQKNAIISYQ